MNKSNNILIQNNIYIMITNAFILQCKNNQQSNLILILYKKYTIYI